MSAVFLPVFPTIVATQRPHRHQRVNTNTRPKVEEHAGHRQLCICYPEAVLLRKATSKNIAQDLVLLFSHMGLPSELLTDQGTPFMSKLMADVYWLLQVNQICTLVQKGKNLTACQQHELEELLEKF